MNEVLFLTCDLFRIFVKGRKEVVFLLCGSDQSVHMFCEVSHIINKYQVSYDHGSYERSLSDCKNYVT